MVWIAQLLPSQTSASVAGAFGPPAPEDPTAVHALGELHDTPYSTLSCAPLGTGVAWIAQLLPFQSSANVTTAPLLFVKSPTAMHELAEVHDTPSSSLP